LSKFSKKKIALRKHKCPRFSQKKIVKNNDKILLKKKKLLHGGWDHLKVTQLHTHEKERMPGSDSIFSNMQKFVLTHTDEILPDKLHLPPQNFLAVHEKKVFGC